MPKALTRRTTAAPRHSGMSHEIAKLLLEHAETFLERTEAIKSALSLGMPLSEIEKYLDWLDSVRGTDKSPPKGGSRKPSPPGGSP
jgi:DNA-binding transcriptional MerR regulator